MNFVKIGDEFINLDHVAKITIKGDEVHLKKLDGATIAQTKGQEAHVIIDRLLKAIKKGAEQTAPAK